MIYILGRKGSKSAKEVASESGIARLTKRTVLSKSDIVINYGMAGAKLAEFLKACPSLKKARLYNKHCGQNKLSVIRKAEKAGISVPETRTTLDKKVDRNEWIIKRKRSSKGIGIRTAHGNVANSSEYYQKMVSNRIYELRVHRFMWSEISKGRIYKRVSSKKDQIAWNYDKGGHFIKIRDTEVGVFKEAFDIAKKALKTTGLDFGAVDFIVTPDDILFLEINSCPGVTDLSRWIYVEEFNKIR